MPKPRLAFDPCADCLHPRAAHAERGAGPCKRHTTQLGIGRRGGPEPVTLRCTCAAFTETE